MTKDEARSLWEAAKARTNALDGCVGPHDFEDLDPERKIGKTWRCRLCKASSAASRSYYEQGLRHGRAGNE